jgi:hypothetical protein
MLRFVYQLVALAIAFTGAFVVTELIIKYFFISS